MPDNLTRKQRSYCMSRVRTRNTDLERVVADAFRQRAVQFEVQASDLPGRPDIVFRAERLAVFVDGDFWHGFRFPLWRTNVAPFWQEKIATNRRRDLRNFAALRRAGWRVVRLWQHQVRRDLDGCIDAVMALLRVPNRTRRAGDSRLRSARRRT